MSAEIAGAAPAALALEDLTIEEALDGRESALDFIARKQPEIDEARKALADYETIIQLRMEQAGAKKFERGDWRGVFKRVKSGAAKAFEDALCRTEISNAGLVPQSEIDDAFKVVIAEPTVKADLRKLRKLAEYGESVAAIIRAHIIEPYEREVFILERIPRNVTPLLPEVKG